MNKYLVMCAFAALAAVTAITTAYARDTHRRKPPEEAFAACEGQSKAWRVRLHSKAKRLTARVGRLAITKATSFFAFESSHGTHRSMRQPRRRG
ncbi:MAG: hypothetical protein R3A47_10940 [Polyangiales bacterium]